MRSLTRILIFPIVLLALQTLGGPTAEASGGHAGGNLKVMTWNVDGGRCGTNPPMHPFAQVIRDHKPDVVAIQEIHRDQADRLAQSTELHHVFFVGTQDCKGSRPDFGIAILSRIPFEGGSAKAYPFYSENPLVNANNPADTARSEYRKLAGISIRVSGRLIRIYDTHLTSIGNASAFVNYYRVRQVARVLTYIADDRKHSAETFWPILMGDFNSQPNVFAYTLLLTEFRDAGPHGEYTTRGRKRLDYGFLDKSAGFAVDEAGVLATGRISDHFPIVVRLSFN
jgi:endonuclease/exonuclease/phosphatase family metal-dependent hydrolase